MSEAKYYTSGGVVVTRAQRAAAIQRRAHAAAHLGHEPVSFAVNEIADAKRRKFWYTAGELFDRQKAHPGESITDSLEAMAALNAKPKKVSTNMIHARELDINAVTTVSDLFELIDLPYRITKHAQLSIVSHTYHSGFAYTLRLEWRGEPE